MGRFAALAAVVAGLASTPAGGPVAGSGRAWAQDPVAPDNPASNTPVNGQVHVLREDDVVVDFLHESSTLALVQDLLLTKGAGVDTRVPSPDMAIVTPFFAVGAGRVFLFDRDVVVRAAVNNNIEPVVTLTIEDHGSAGQPPASVSVTLPPSDSAVEPLPQALVLADFTGDLFDDVAVLYGNQGDTSNASRLAIRIGTAEDVTDFSKGLRFGPERQLPTDIVDVDVGAGDLNADGTPEVVLLGLDAGTRVQPLASIATVAPETLAISAPQTPFAIDTTESNSGITGAERATLAVGDFDGDRFDREVAVVWGRCTEVDVRCALAVTSYNFTFDENTRQFTPRTAGSFFFDEAFSSAPFNTLTGLAVAAGPLGWFSEDSGDQLVIAVGARTTSGSRFTAPLNGIGVVVADFFDDPEFNVDIGLAEPQIAASQAIVADPRVCLADVAVGRFDQPSFPDEPLRDNQVALLTATLAAGADPSTCGDRGFDQFQEVLPVSYAVRIYDVDPAHDYKLDLANDRSPYTRGIAQPARGGLPRMAVGDTQGRSLRLGTPLVVKVANHAQVEVVLNAPPMHVDYFTPPGESPRKECFDPLTIDLGNPALLTADGAPNSLAPSTQTIPAARAKAADCLRNGSGFPGGCSYCAKYETKADAKTGQSHKQSSSGTLASATTTNEKVSFGITDFEQVSAEWEQAVKNSVEKHTGSFDKTLETTTFDLSVTTVEDDEVYFMTRDLYFYYYPVLDRKDEDGNQLILQLSRPVPPKQSERSLAAGASIEWYQPPHQVGNVLSYPGSVGQLLAVYPEARPEDVQSLVGFNTNTEMTTTVTWVKESSEGTNVGSVQTYEKDKKASYSAQISVPLGAEIPYFVSASGGITVATSESTSDDVMGSNEQSFSNSTGFTIVGDDPFTGAGETAENLVHHVTPYVLNGIPYQGQNTFDEPDYPNVGGSEFEPARVVDGPHRLVYTVDVLSGAGVNLGKWWEEVYDAGSPDVALNHPSQFGYRTRTSTAPLTDWWSFHPALSFWSGTFEGDLTTVHTDQFYWMKGLFVNPADAPGEAGPMVPNLNVGAAYQLQARVYNYSLVDVNLPVQVQFYGHRMADDGETWAAGGCFYIGKHTIPAGTLQGFRSDLGADGAPVQPPNWTLAGTTFTPPADLAHETIKFWVVAWIEDDNGALVKEMPQKGLTSAPPSGACPSNSLTGEDLSIVGVEIEFYSNNVGYYDQAFTVLPATEPGSTNPVAVAAAEPRPGAEGAEEADAFVTIEDVEVLADEPVVGGPFEIRTHLRAGGADVPGIMVVYDLDPKEEGIHDVEHVPHFRAGEKFVDSILFEPDRCGEHVLSIEARPVDHAIATDEVIFDVPCRPRDLLSFFIQAAGAIDVDGLPHPDRAGWAFMIIERALRQADHLAGAGAERAACRRYDWLLERLLGWTWPVGDEAVDALSLDLEFMIDDVRLDLGCGSA